MITTFRVINKVNNVVREFEEASKVAIYFLGRQVSDYIVVKSDYRGDRVVSFSEYEVTSLERDMEDA